MAKNVVSLARAFRLWLAEQLDKVLVANDFAKCLRGSNDVVPDGSKLVFVGLPLSRGEQTVASRRDLDVIQCVRTLSSCPTE